MKNEKGCEGITLQPFTPKLKFGEAKQYERVRIWKFDPSKE